MLKVHVYVKSVYNSLISCVDVTYSWDLWLSIIQELCDSAVCCACWAVVSARSLQEAVAPLLCLLQLHCCGLFSSADWEQNIPDSCLCQPAEEGTGDECQTVDYQVRNDS